MQKARALIAPTYEDGRRGLSQRETMKSNWFIKMLATYDYHGVTNFLESMAPSFRHSVTKFLLLVSITYPSFKAVVDMFFPAVEASMGIAGGAFVTMIVAFVVELISGIVASQMRKEQFSSLKLSRFSFKVFIYLVLIAIPFHWKMNFASHHNDFMAAIFDWLQSFLIVQIALENLVSILENLAVITGKDKTAWINKIQDFFTSKVSAEPVEPEHEAEPETEVQK